MKYNIFEKIIKSHSYQKDIAVGDIVEVYVDRMMIHDFFAPFCINKFNEMGFPKVADPDRVVFVYDHLVPSSSTDDLRHHRSVEKFIAAHGIHNIHRSDGICHQLMHEAGYVKPGDIVVGTDSHTVTYGAIGVLATGIGYTEMAAVIGTGKLWLRVVPTIKVRVNGNLQNGVYSKDLILHILQDLKCDGASYKILEFSGSTIANMSVDERLTLSNMSVEAGAKAGLIEPDGKTLNYLVRHFSRDQVDLLQDQIKEYQSDDEAVYEKVLDYEASTIKPKLACPYNVDNVKDISECTGLKIDQAFLGSCTNGRLEDIAIASNILEGKRVNRDVRFIVVPASRTILLHAIRKGYIETLIKAGAIIMHPSCGLCCGRNGGLLENGERVISSNNRNFLGRMGGEKVEIFLGSPATVAASALEGKIADCRNYL